MLVLVAQHSLQDKVIMTCAVLDDKFHPRMRSLQNIVELYDRVDDGFHTATPYEDILDFALQSFEPFVVGLGRIVETVPFLSA